MQMLDKRKKTILILDKVDFKSRKWPGTKKDIRNVKGESTKDTTIIILNAPDNF